MEATSPVQDLINLVQALETQDTDATIIASLKARVVASLLSGPNNVNIGLLASQTFFALQIVRNGLNSDASILIENGTAGGFTQVGCGEDITQGEQLGERFCTLSFNNRGRSNADFNHLSSSGELRVGPGVAPTLTNALIILTEGPSPIRFATNGVAFAQEKLRIETDANIADTETAILVTRNLAGVFTLEKVSMGVVDSGGAGFRLLRVPN